MDSEIIDRVEVLDTGELLLGLKSAGNPIYQYVYREAAGVYWDQNRRGFKSTPMKEWSCSQWFNQIVDIVRTGLGVELILDTNVFWFNIPDREKERIQSENAI